MDTTPHEYSRSQIAGFIRNLSQEDKEWVVRLIIAGKPKVQPAEPAQGQRPAWWNYPISADTLALVPEKHGELDDDDDETLSQILMARYL